MCGIFGYIGKNDPLQSCVMGLELLEYRGYDSSGIAGIAEGEIAICKEVGKLSNLKNRLTLKALEVAIGHTRWATHGKVTQENAHPHKDMKTEIALVHNGIIENCDELKEDLEKEGVSFSSETDTEIIAQLISKNYRGDLVQAVHRSLPFLKGQFAIALIHKNHPDQIIASARHCPLSIGTDDAHSESIISSDPNAFCGKPLNIVFLKNGEIAKVERGKISVFNSDLIPIEKKAERLDGDFLPPSKEGFAHYLLKEIFEQPKTIQKAFLGRMQEDMVEIEEIDPELFQTSSIHFIACGTSCHAGEIGALFLEEIAKIPSNAEIASEARYRILPKDCLVIALSQSGETADTISAVRTLREKGHKVLGICNVKNSTLTRETDGCIFLKAGPEISVCSTKAFTSQITVLYLLSLFLAKKSAQGFLREIPMQIQEVLAQSEYIRKIAFRYSHFPHFFFMGRRYMYPTALEAALKLKEISYVNASGYPAGELKHGPIALIDENFPVLAFLANRQSEEKMISNLQEVKARGAPILAIAPKHLKIAEKIADDCIWVPDTIDPLAPFASSVAAQLFAYFIALKRGCHIDQPRNLAKSVTVE